MRQKEITQRNHRVPDMVNSTLGVLFFYGYRAQVIRARLGALKSESLGPFLCFLLPCLGIATKFFAFLELPVK